MHININASFTLKQQEQLKKELGIDENGEVQKYIDLSTIHYLKLLMPRESGMMISNTRRVNPGIIRVETPYAHYMNEGILYVDPITQKGAFHDPVSGRFWSRPNTKKIPSSRTLNYHGGPNRGAHFVERTLTGHFEDILREAKKGLKK